MPLGGVTPPPPILASSGASANPDASFDVVSLKNRLPMKLLKLNVSCFGVLGRRVGLQVITVGCTVGLVVVVILLEVWLLDTDDDKEYLLLSSLAIFVSYGSGIEEEEDDDGTTPFTSSCTTSFIPTP